MRRMRFRQIRRIVIVGLAPVAMAAWSATQAAEPAAAEAPVAGDAVVARVDGEGISANAFRSFFVAYATKKRFHGFTPDVRAQLAGEALGAMVDEMLLLREADRRGIEADAAKVAEHLAQVRARYAGKSKPGAEFEQRLKAVEEKLVDEGKIAALKTAIQDTGEVSPEAVRDFYEKNPQIFTMPRSTDVSVILIGVPPYAPAQDWDAAAETADEIFARLKAGESFESLASAFSTDPSGKAGGGLGPVHDGQFPDGVTEKLDKVAIGGLTAPIRTLEGMAILRVNARIPAELASFEDSRARAEAHLRRRNGEAQWNDFLEALHANVTIEQVRKPDDVVSDF